jgi:hypothetical protein
VIVGLAAVSSVKNFGNLCQHTLALSGVFTLDGAQDTGVEVTIEDLSTDFIKRALNGLDLPDDVNAVLIFFQHPLNAADVSFNGF